MLFNKLQDFIDFTGMLDDEETFVHLAIKPDEENGAFSIKRLDELVAFCDENPAYHILTEIDDEEGKAMFILVNEIRVINRINYYLARSSTEQATYKE